jgi:hypothetical protein
VPAPIVGDNAVVMLQKEQHLVVPVVCTQGPTMMKHNWLALSPILIKDFRTVFGCNVGHIRAPMLVVLTLPANWLHFGNPCPEVSSINIDLIAAIFAPPRWGGSVWALTARDAGAGLH